MTQPESFNSTTIRSGFECHFEQNAASEALSAQLGTAVGLMAASAKHSALPVSYAAEWLMPAIATRQIRIFCDRRGRPVGYLTWAFLTEATEQRWLANPNGILHLSEWNEGTRLWLIDLVALPGFGTSIMRQVKTALFPDHGVWRWLRVRGSPPTETEHPASGNSQDPRQYRTMIWQRELSRLTRSI